MKIAKEYSHLCVDKELGAEIYQLIRDEYDRTVMQVLNVTGQQCLLEDNETLALSLSRRNPYLDPLNFIQLILILRFRNEKLEDSDKQIWLDVLLRTINGIATGMRNTG